MEQTIPKGYKQAEVGVIPDDWEDTMLRSLVTLQRGHDLTWRDRRDGNVPIMGSAGHNGFHDVALAKGPGVVLGRSGASFGQAHCCTQDFWPHNTALYVTDFFGNDPLFVFYFLSNFDFTRHNSGGAQQSLNRNFIAPIPIGMPSPTEQTAIANALSDVDTLITALEKLIAKKCAIKTAAMQQLLTGKKRLPPFNQAHTGYKQTELGEVPEDWAVILFKEVCNSFKTGKLDANAMKPDGEYRFYTCAKNYSLIDTYAFDTEALLVSGNGANVGYVHYYKGKFNAYQRTYVLSEFIADVGYLKLYLERKLADRIRVEVNAGNTPYITMDTLTDMAVVVPSSIDEQAAIATVLSDMEKEIEALEQRLNKTQQLKQGMMQELLTGRTRLV